eukprot:scaffold57781_cov28-Tisochrysis_lutea.AAC.9
MEPGEKGLGEENLKIASRLACGLGPLSCSHTHTPYLFLPHPRLPCGYSSRALLGGSGCGGGGVELGATTYN